MIKNILQWLLVGTVALASNPDPSNNFKFGDGTASNKNLQFNRQQGSTINPAIRWNESGQQLEFTNDGTNYSGIGSGSGSGGGGFNIIATNPGFENGVALGWSSVGSQAFLPVTSGSNLLFGKGSATFQTFGAGSMQSSQYTIPNGLAGQPCLVSVAYKGSDNNISLQAIDGSSNVLASTPFVTSATSSTLSVPFSCPASGTVALRILGSTSSALVALDQMYLGQQTSLLQLSQAQLLGTVIMSGCGSNWTNTGALGAFAPVTGCSYATTGILQAPATQIPGFILPNVGPGSVQVIAVGYYQADGTANNAEGEFAISDGVTTGTGQPSGFTISTGTSTALQSGLIQNTFLYSSVQTNKTYQIFGGINAGTNVLVSGNNGVEFDVYYFPTQAQTAFNPATAAWYVDASYAGYSIAAGQTNVYYQSGSALSTNVGSLPASVPCSGTNPPESGNCTSGTSENGISYVQPVPGIVEVCVHIGMQLEASSNNGNFNYAIDRTANADDTVVVTPGVKIGLDQAFVVGQFIANNRSDNLCEKFNVPAAGLVTFRLNQTTGPGGTTYNNNVTDWTVRPINQPVPAPVLMNQIVTPSTGVEMIARVNFGDSSGSMAAPANCTTDPCTIYSQSGNWVSAVNRAGTGVYHLTINPIFGDFPTCHSTVLTGLGSPATECVATSLTQVACIISTGGTGFDGAQGVICMGPAATP